MKIKITIFLTALFMTCSTFAQNFKGHASGTYGIINGKIRAQYELPLKDRASFGININYYLVNWTGPVLEPFIRVYGRNGNEEGFFGQFKVCYGNLSFADFNPLYQENTRFSTYGFGMSCGYKFLIGDNFTIEPLVGYRLLTPPIVTYKSGYSEEYLESYDLVESFSWYLLTGFPIDYHLKFGYQF